MKFWRQKLQSCVLGLKFFSTKISYKKQASKTLMKLTAGGIGLKCTTSDQKKNGALDLKK